jgi:hypothetical protein
MLGANRHAFKEWAVTCAALAEGTQALLLRKGGIHERQGQFAVEQREFWLFPTRFHQNPTEIREDAHDLLERMASQSPPANTIWLSLYAVVEDVIEFRDESQLPPLAGLQILSPETVAERFHYRRPGLFVLPVRIYRRQESIALPDSPHFAGCRTWVDLPSELSTDGLTPVLDDRAAQEQLNAIRRSIAGPQTA